jgi:hypothetical protein
MFWHLLTKREQDMLYHAEKKGIRHRVKLYTACHFYLHRDDVGVVFLVGEGNSREP